jgi:hypothetical protein
MLDELTTKEIFVMEKALEKREVSSLVVKIMKALEFDQSSELDEIEQIQVISAAFGICLSALLDSAIIHEYSLEYSLAIKYSIADIIYNMIKECLNKLHDERLKNNKLGH